jgi:hypothetical protein
VARARRDQITGVLVKKEYTDRLDAQGAADLLGRSLAETVDLALAADGFGKTIDRSKFLVPGLKLLGGQRQFALGQGKSQKEFVLLAFWQRRPAAILGAVRHGREQKKSEGIVPDTDRRSK